MPQVLFYSCLRVTYTSAIHHFSGNAGGCSRPGRDCIAPSSARIGAGNGTGRPSVLLIQTSVAPPAAYGEPGSSARSMVTKVSMLVRPGWETYNFTTNSPG